MGTMKAFYVQKFTVDAVAAIRETFPSGVVTGTSTFTGVILSSDAETPVQVLMELSARLETDVMWLSFQSAVDAFEYYHWQKGVLLRALVYGCYVQERTWERVEGQPEGWEQTAFFDPEHLVFLLDDEDDEDKPSDAEKQRLEQFWQAGELVVGQMEPYLSARECARHVANYYGLPGWDS